MASKRILGIYERPIQFSTTHHKFSMIFKFDNFGGQIFFPLECFMFFLCHSATVQFYCAIWSIIILNNVISVRKHFYSHMMNLFTRNFTIILVIDSSKQITVFLRYNPQLLLIYLQVYHLTLRKGQLCLIASFGCIQIYKRLAAENRLNDDSLE